MNIKRVIAAAALAVVPLTASSTALAAPAAPQGAPAAAAAVPVQVSPEGAQYANTILNKVNELRRKLNLQPVTRYQEFDAVAQDWSEHQAETETMAHRPEFYNSYPGYKTDKNYTTASENVAMRGDGGDIGAQLFQQWLESPGHYKNMTDPNANIIGIGIAQNPNSGNWYATQNFAGYSGNIPFTPTGDTTPPPTTAPPTATTAPSPTPTPETTPSTPSIRTTPRRSPSSPWPFPIRAPTAHSAASCSPTSP